MLPIFMRVIPALLLFVFISFFGNLAFAQVQKDAPAKDTDSESIINKNTKNSENPWFVDDEEFHNRESNAEKFQCGEVEVTSVKISEQEYVETSETISGSGSISGSNNGINNNLPNPGNDPLD
jgi:hypothetical protein